MTVEITLRGAVPADVVDDTRTKVEHLAQYAHEPILAARVVLTVAPDPAVPLRHRAECSLDVNGTMVRAHAVAADMVTAVDLLEGKLQKNLVQHDDRVRTRHRWIGVATEHEWRHGNLPEQRDTHFPRPPAQRELVRRKTFACEPMTPDEAAFEMDLLGHDFYLFTDRRSGKDAVVYRDREGRFAVQGEPVAEGPTAALVQLTGAAPTLSEPEARGRLDLTEEPFLFYLDAESGRGRVLYVRYDGHYGLITAPDD
ncbi:MAG: ribosome hibernation promotion factor [Nocardioidaceae bacterium]